MAASSKPSWIIYIVLKHACLEWPIALHVCARQNVYVTGWERKWVHGGSTNCVLYSRNIKTTCLTLSRFLPFATITVMQCVFWRLYITTSLHLVLHLIYARMTFGRSIDRCVSSASWCRKLVSLEPHHRTVLEVFCNVNQFYALIHQRFHYNSRFDLNSLYVCLMFSRQQMKKH